MIRRDPDYDGWAYEEPDDERQPRPRTKKRDKVHTKWRPLRNERPEVVKGFGC